jgi:hypothetical protein
MADWRKVAMAAILADGKIDEAEVKVLKKELYADGKIDKDEVLFLIELRSVAQKKAKKEELLPVFEKFFFKAVSDNVLDNGRISARETHWLREAIFADKKIDAGEFEFINSLNKKAKEKNPEFVALVEEVTKKFKK